MLEGGGVKGASDVWVSDLDETLGFGVVAGVVAVLR